MRAGGDGICVVILVLLALSLQGDSAVVLYVVTQSPDCLVLALCTAVKSSSLVSIESLLPVIPCVHHRRVRREFYSLG